MMFFRAQRDRFRYSWILLKQLVVTDFKLRYQGSVLGYAWSLLRPLFMFAVLYLVFAVIFKVGRGVPHFPIYLLMGIVLWNFFAEMTNQSLVSIVGRGDLIRKIRIPRWLIVVSTSASALINLFLNLVVVFVFAALNHLPLLGSTIKLPFYIAEVYLFALGISLILATLYVKYRDISYVWEVGIQAGFYATPILYPIGLITNVKFQKLLLLNPMAQAIQGARHSFVTHETVTAATVYRSLLGTVAPAVIVLLFLVVGLLIFRKEAKYFAENL